MAKIVLSHELCVEVMAYLNQKVEKTIICGGGTPDELLPEIEDADGVIIRIGYLDSAAIEKCKKLKVIGRPGAGYDNIDVSAATKRGIPIIFTPGANTRAVAEHTIGFIFSAAKNSILMDSEMRKINYGIRLKRNSIQLQGKILLVVGFGAIGRTVSEMASNLGMKVAVYDPYASETEIKGNNYIFVDDLLTFLPRADVLTLHCPLTEETRGLIGRKEINQLKKSAIIINCARGGIVDEKELGEALQQEKIFGAGIDVLEEEPVTSSNRLLQTHNIILSPHTAGMTKEALTDSQKSCVDGMLSVLEGKKWPYTVNPDVYNNINHYKH